MNGSRYLLLGFFFLAAVGLIAGYSLSIFDNSWFGQPILLRAEFPAANGLRVGDSVRVSGMSIGRVTQMTFDAKADPDRRVAVTLSLDEPLDIREGYQVLIEETTLLGGRNVNIDMGPPEAPLLAIDENTILDGSLEAPPLEALTQVGDLVAENREAVYSFISNLDAVMASVRAGEGTIGRLVSDEELGNRVGEAVEDFAVVVEDVSAITGTVRQGEGTIGRLLMEDDIYVAAEEFVDDLRGGMADLRVIITDLEAGQGTMGALFRDDELADTVRGAIDDIGSIVARAERGEGTLGRILADDAIADDIEELLASLNSTDSVLGGLINDDRMGEDLRTALADIREIVATVRRGEGSIGQLLMSDVAYDELLAALGLLTRSLEDYREAAPVSTFTNVLFGAF